ncbi:substrate-binding domain-containing protein, partial [Streptococcus suis]
GIEFNEGLVFASKYNSEEGYSLADRIVNAGATAAYVAEDEIAAGVLNGVSEMGVKVPEDCEIITSDDSLETQFTRPN